MSEFVTLIGEINVVCTDGIEPLIHPQAELCQRLQPDVAAQTESREELQACAPATGDGYYLVPKVID